MAKKGSWKHELDVKYNRLMNSGDITLIDKANEVILDAIAKLDALKTHKPRA